jgi:4-alpha-glucanotransferase
VSDRELRRRAEALGVSVSYLDWRKNTVAASAETLAAILDALGGTPLTAGGAQDIAAASRSAQREGAGAGEGRPRRGGAGEGERQSRRGEDGGAPRPGAAAPRIPRARSWGFTVQLYSLRSGKSWGHGDLRDLADLAVWSASELGAGFVLVNPLHAAEPLPPVSPSPYLPMTRRFTSPLYLRIEDIPEYGQLPGNDRGRIDALAAPLRERNTTPDLIDRDAVWTAKRTALKIIYELPMRASRRAACDRYRQREGSELDGWSAWCALAERHGPDWRGWPDQARAQRAGAEAIARLGLHAAADFHAWLQWLADEQMAAAQRAAKAAGMRTGIIHDLAVGVHPGGADAWAHQDLFVRGISVGAPPDGFNQLGQDWAQPPMHPQRLAAAGYRPLAALYASGLRHAGGLRVDHVMGLMRLWWVPEGMPPDRGAYVKYDHTAMVGTLAGQAARAGALAIGEDLGTVDPWIRNYLAVHGILGTSLLWFARESDGTPLLAQHWRPGCMATVGTHDVPPVSGFLSGEQVTVRARLGLLKDPETERKSAELMLSRWQDALTRQGLIRPGPRPDVAEFTVALYAYLARTPAALVGVSLADAVGDRRTQNIPGTSDEYPNWRIPLCDGDGKAVLLDDLAELPLLRAVARAARP